MRGAFNPAYKEVSIIGAGFAGLSLAYFLEKAGYHIKLYEAADRVGGLIQTKQTPYGLAETAAHSTRATAPVIDMCAEIGVDLLAARNTKKYIWRNGLKRFPLKVGEAISLGWHLIFARARAEDITLADWATRHLGKGGLKNLIVPMANGIFSAPPEALDVRAAFPSMAVPVGKTLLSHLLTSRSKTGAKIMAPHHGMQEIIDKLFQYLERAPRVEIFLNESVTVLPDVPNIAITTDAAAAGKLIGVKNLENLTCVPLVAATVFVETQNFPKGVGVLHAANMGRQSLGILFNSSAFENRTTGEGYTSFTVMLGGLGNASILNKSDNAIKDILQQELEDIVGLKTPLVHAEIARWAKAIPVYNKELVSLWAALDQGWCAPPGHVLFGNYTGDVSLRGMVERLNTTVETRPLGQDIHQAAA